MSRVKYHRTYLKLHGQYEKYAYPIIKKALDEQIKPVIKWLNEDNFDALDAYLDYLLSTVPIRDALSEIYPTIGKSAATFSYNYIQRYAERKDLAFFSEEWVQMMIEFFNLYSGNKIAGITQTTVERIRQVLADSTELNLSRRDQARYIEDQLRSPEFNRARALVIARTESTTAANYGINKGAEATDYEVEKIWIDTKDKRTRRAHLQAGQSEPIPMNQAFIVGGEEMLYPGQIGASAANVVNCRCVMGTVVLEDEYGLPILKQRIGNAAVISR